MRARFSVFRIGYVICIGLWLAACQGSPQSDSHAQEQDSRPIAVGGAGGVSGGQSASGTGGGPPSSGGTSASAGSGGAGTSGTAGSVGGSAGQPSNATPDAGPADAGAADAGAPDAGAPNDRCDAARQVAGVAPRALEVSGNLGTHDPTLIEQDGVFYLYQTGPRLPGKRSADLQRWDDHPSALGAANPAWVAAEVPAARDLWAPDLSHFGGLYHLYYSASSFGSNRSCIGHATRASLASGTFTDHGPVVCSTASDDWNAIDPNVIVDEQGTAWLAFGSFWDGIMAIELDASGARANDDLHALASRGGGAIEAPVIVRRCGYYYLFVSFDRCCNGASSTYNIRVGRSEDVLGPYVDRAGVRMLDGGGTLLVTGNDVWKGPGHNAVIFSGERAYDVHHAYSASNGASSLRVSELVWDAEGWPLSGGP